MTKKLPSKELLDDIAGRIQASCQSVSLDIGKIIVKETTILALKAGVSLSWVSDDIGEKWRVELLIPLYNHTQQQYETMTHVVGVYTTELLDNGLLEAISFLANMKIRVTLQRWRREHPEHDI